MIPMYLTLIALYFFLKKGLTPYTTLILWTLKRIAEKHNGKSQVAKERGHSYRWQ